jgi:hypothetical protein
VFPVRYELGFYSPEDGILYSDCRENLKSYRALSGWAMKPLTKFWQLECIDFCEIQSIADFVMQ